MLSQEIYRGHVSLHQTPPPSSSFLLRFILPPAPQATTRLHLLFVVADVAEVGSVVMVVDVPSHHHISMSVADLNTRSAIVLVIMLISATIVIMVLLLRLAQLHFSTLMRIIQAIPTGMLTLKPLNT